MFKNFFANEEGQGMVEYGLIIALIAIVVLGALSLMGEKVEAVFNGAAGKINSVLTPGSNSNSDTNVTP